MSEHSDQRNVTPTPHLLPPSGRCAALFHKAADVVEAWMVDSGALDQLAMLVTKTDLPRLLVFGCATALISRGAIEGSAGQIILGAVVSVLIGTVNAFVTRIRNKYAGQVQAIAGAHPDHFIGPETVTQVADIAAKAAATGRLGTDTQP